MIFEKKLLPADNEILQHLEEDGFLLIKNYLTLEDVVTLRNYFFSLINSQWPSYLPVCQGQVDNLRASRSHPDAAVKSDMEVLSFYEWNQNRLDLFENFKEIFELKDRLADKMLSNSFTLDKTFRRISVQFYQAGRGYFARHVDPSSVYQSVVITIELTTRGVDYSLGGLQVRNRLNEEIDLSQVFQAGDIMFFDPSLEHEVRLVEGNPKKLPYLINGRLMMIIARNAETGNSLGIGYER
jgi:hypothetical protein